MKEQTEMEGIDEGRAAKIPVDPDSKPITRGTRIVELGKADRSNASDPEAMLDIELQDDEKRLFRSLLLTTEAMKEGRLKSAPEGVESIQVRVAGGWVRDKVLGLGSHDVDIAVDACTGVQFATMVKEYVSDFEHGQCGRIGVIAANPAQSKHLETATMKIYGVEVDFCNLRHETYAEDSRIPTSVMGTPLEDSYRRDFTMNALYYNLHTQQVEDWTRQGLSDLLDTKQVVTPLEAFQTFHDDPLRVLRAIRFAVRYEMRLSDNLQAACVHPQIHKELHRKVSRERVGKELEAMLSGKRANPLQALKLICDLRLGGSVFCLPPPQVPIRGTIGLTRLEQMPYLAEKESDLVHIRHLAWEESRACLELLPKMLKILPEVGEGQTSFDARLLYLAVVLLPYEHLQYLEKKKVKYISEYMIRDGIKFKNKDVQHMASIAENLDDMVQLLQQTPEAKPSMRLRAGLLMRNAKELWVSVLLVATVSLLRKKGTSSFDWMERAKQWHSTIVDKLHLEACWKNKPLMNGKDLIQVLGVPSGPQVGVYNQEQVHWMLMNPDGTLEECRSHLRAFQKEREREQDQAAQHIRKKMHL